eukprot:2169046-Pleurochrysis_carterae.AAC.1
MRNPNFGGIGGISPRAASSRLAMAVSGSTNRYATRPSPWRGSITVNNRARNRQHGPQVSGVALQGSYVRGRGRSTATDATVRCGVC